MTRIDPVRVRKTRQSLQRVEEPFGAFAGLDCKIRPRGVADEERVAGQDETFSDHEGAVLRTVARRVDDSDAHGAGLELPAVIERIERKLGLA